jgi:hypothetical protein
MATPLHTYEKRRAVTLFALAIILNAFLRVPAFSQSRVTGAQTRITTNIQTGTTYTVTSTDCGKLLSLSNASGIAITLPAGASGLVAGCWMDIQNTGTGLITLTSSSLIDGVSGVSLAANQGLRLVSNGTGYFTQRGQGSTANSSMSIQSGGVPLGPVTTMNLAAGTGVSCIPQVNAGTLTFQCNADTSYLATKASLQSSANPQICTSSSGNGSAFTASCATTLNAYGANQTLYWYADVANTSTAPTLNIDTLGAKSLVREDGSALAVGDIKSAAQYRIWYDGNYFHVVEAGLSAGAAGAGSYSRLAEIVVTSETPTVTLSNIPSTYRSLILRITAHSNGPGGAQPGYMQFNGDTGANYSVVYAGTWSGSTFSASQPQLFYLNAGSSLGNSTCTATITINQYANTAWLKNAEFQYTTIQNSTISSMWTFFGSFNWASSAAINSVLIGMTSGNFVSGSVFTLYGEN